MLERDHLKSSKNEEVFVLNSFWRLQFEREQIEDIWVFHSRPEEIAARNSGDRIETEKIRDFT